MSQQLTPVNGGVIPEVQTTTAPDRLLVLSQPYIDVKNLHTRPTEWVPGGRPIYRRLPATAETYQVDFFNVVNESNILGNNFTRYGLEEVGYVYIPYGESINGPTSTEVVAAEGNETLLIKGGNIVWKYGKDEVLPTIVDLSVLDVGVGKYDIAYQLIYDDSPVPHLYEVSDFALTGIPLNITSSTDDLIGWRHPAKDAFLNTTNLFWSNEDNFFTISFPAVPFIQWESELAQSYTKLTLRCPTGTAYSGTATLSYVNGSTLSPVQTVEVSADSTGQYFEFTPQEASLQTGWNVSFSAVNVSVQSITVSGVVTLLESQAAASPRSALVMYPSRALPPTVTNTRGKEVPAAYCTLAEVDVGVDYAILDINDTRSIIHRDFTPVADWLTVPFDQDLINLYEQVSDYSTLWMAPPTSLKQEYANLSSDQVIVEA